MHGKHMGCTTQLPCLCPPPRMLHTAAAAAAAHVRAALRCALACRRACAPLQARRSSAYTTKASGVKQDPRPVSDKGFQQARLPALRLFAHVWLPRSGAPCAAAVEDSGCSP